MRTILVAPTAFKGTHAAAAVADAAARGARATAGCVVEAMPVSDGGPGLLDALAHRRSGAIEACTVSDPLGRPTAARVFLDADMAVIESADACGLHLLRMHERDPLRASTYGVGELILHAAARRPHVVIGVGGSATIDAGLGLAAALGYRLYDDHDRLLERGDHAAISLARIEKTNTTLPRMTVLTDVRNPLFGPNGAARVFGPQKGATPEVVARLDHALEKVAGIIRRDLGVEVTMLEGGGAAGGLAAGLHAFAGAALVSGSDWVLDQLGFERALARAAVVITGEGAYDAQSTMGKITGEIVVRAHRRGIPVLLIAGSVSSALPANVHAVTGAALTLADIERLVSTELPRLLSASG